MGNDENLNFFAAGAIIPSQFNRHFMRENDLQGGGFESWVFCPGMLFHAQDRWWGDRGRRQKPHEGLDLCLYRDRRNQTHGMEINTRIPVLYDGVAVGIIDDFLGKSIIVEHHVTRGDPMILYSFYGHTTPGQHLYPGSIVRAGDIIATIAGAGRSKSGVLPHLHLSLGRASRVISPDQLTWETLDALDALTLLDPLTVIG
ncbi:MAG: hypothetical protein Q8P24_20190 [Desulfobacterales bacterium]|nr:hypothetical protein [Desulfobacterales bacterium]